MDPKTPTPETMPESKKKVAFNVAKLDSDHPIPREQFGFGHVAVKDFRYIPFLGDDDKFFETLAEARLLSPTNNACVSTKAKYTCGTGWTFNDETLDADFKTWAKSVNRNGHSLNRIIKSVADNLYSSGNIFINVVRANIGSTKKIRLYIKNNFDCRLAYTDDPDVVTHVLISNFFRSNDSYVGIPKEIDAIPLWCGDLKRQRWFKDKKGNEHMVIHIKNDVTSMDFYGLPSNVASLLIQQLEYKSARFNVDNFDNNMNVGGILFLQAQMTDAEAGKLAKKIVSTHTGDGNRGRVMVMANEEGFEGTKYEQNTQSTDGSFIELDRRNEEKIIIANEWDGTLAGIKTGSSLGRGTGYFKEIFEIKYKTVIRPEQEKIIDEFLEPLLLILDDVQKTNFANNKIDIITPMPVSYGSEINPNKVMTIKEGRKYFPGLLDDDIDPEIAKQIIDSSSSNQKNNVPNPTT